MKTLRIFTFENEDEFEFRVFQSRADQTGLREATYSSPPWDGRACQ